MGAMPTIDARIEALDAQLKPLKVRPQRKQTRVKSARRSIYAALLLATMGVDEVNATTTPPSPCPGATAWNEAHREQLPEAMAARDATRTVTDPDLRRELQERFAADQRARKDYLAAPRDPVVARRVDQLDVQNIDWLKALVRDRGIPTAEQVGENGVKWAWLLVQHADRDPKLQATVLPMFVKRYEAGELSGDEIAKLTDRILLAQRKPQRFGTQFNWLSGQFERRQAGEIAEIDAHRRELRLMPLTDYACMMIAKSKNVVSGELSP
jgi:hypothetical protein